MRGKQTAKGNVVTCTYLYVPVYLPLEWHSTPLRPNVSSFAPLPYTLVLTQCSMWQSLEVTSCTRESLHSVTTKQARYIRK